MRSTEQIDEKLLRQYLLGKLPEEELVQVEDRAFTDPAYLAEIQSVEADLIDSYVRGELTAQEQSDFERLFLASPQRRSKVEFARALAHLADENIVEQPSPFQGLVRLFQSWSPSLQFASAAAAVIVAVGAVWLIIDNRATHSLVAELQTKSSTLAQQTQTLQRELYEQRKQSSKPQSLAGPIASLVLLPGLSRAESHSVELILDPATQMARIEIHLDARDSYPRFRAELRTVSGDEILVRSNLTSRPTDGGFAVLLDVPASALIGSPFELALKGLVANQPPKEIGYYYFTVLRK